MSNAHTKGALRLKKLSLRNFKGQREFTLIPDGQNLRVYGDNGTGKTTLADGYFWGMFDKDSLNRKDFDIKTLDPSNEPIHHLEHEVVIELELDGDPRSFRKVYKENWVTKRGHADREFEGHTVDYEVNGVPVQKALYDSRIREIAPEKLFRVMSDPSYFNGVLSWQDRRSLLIDMAGDVTAEDVISSCAELGELPGILGRHTPDEYRKILASTRKAVNTEKAAIPARISEVQRGMPADTEEPANLDALRSALRSLQEDRARIAAGGEIADKTKQLREVEAAIIAYENEARRRAAGGSEETRQAYSRAVAATADCSAAIIKAESSAETAESLAEDIERRLKALREAFHQINDRVFLWEGTETCGACGQPLPAERVAAARAKAEGDFNQKKGADLEANRRDGQSLSRRKAEHLDEAKKYRTQVAELEAKHAALHGERERLGTLVSEVQEVDFSHDAEHGKLLYRKGALEEDIRILETSSAAAISDVNSLIDAKQKEIGHAESISLRLAQRAEAEKRIAELGEREKELGREIERIAREEYLIELFIRTKVSLLEGRINSHFEIVTFRLFETQINGGLVEACECLVGGVPYGSGLNTGAQVNAGLDVIRAFQSHYGLFVPIFIDGAESVTDILPTEGQQIQLVVSAADKVLRTMGGSTVKELQLA